MDRINPVPGAHVGAAVSLALPAPSESEWVDLPGWGFAEYFVIAQTALPALLFLPGTQPVRLPIRVASFAVSLLALAWWVLRQGDPSQPQRHPATGWLLACLGNVGLMIFHPVTNTVQAGAAQLVLYLCVMAPVFWAPALVRSPLHLRRIILILLVCNGINSIVGVLQVYDPARWLPQEFSRIVTESEMGLGPVTYLGPTGELIVRPPGLFDTPGAVAGAGMFAALLGVVFAASRIAWWQRATSLVLAFGGVSAIYLSQVRISLVVVAGMMLIYVLLLASQRRLASATTFLGVSGVLLLAAFTFAVVLGGETVSSRVYTLFEDDPVTIYYASRGGQLVYALDELLFEFPLGAGLGRWGMIARYFADASDFGSPPIWAEIQIAGWLLDGGLILLTLYGAALVSTIWHEWRLARSGDPFVRICAAVVMTVSLGTFALIFTFTPFTTQIGVQFWFLAGALHGAARHTWPGDE